MLVLARLIEAVDVTNHGILQVISKPYSVGIEIQFIPESIYDFCDLFLADLLSPVVIPFSGCSCPDCNRGTKND